ncbi:transglycosylase SLT domain-containing protein [Helicobacter sp. T3_23-1059]
MKISNFLLKGIFVSVGALSLSAINALNASNAVDVFSSNALRSGVLDSSQNLLLDSNDSGEQPSYINFGIDPNSNNGENPAIDSLQNNLSNNLDTAINNQNLKNQDSQQNLQNIESTSLDSTTNTQNSAQSNIAPTENQNPLTTTNATNPQNTLPFIQPTTNTTPSERFLSTTNGGFSPDNKSISTLNSFGVSEEFLASLKTNTILHSQSDDKRWARFVQQFDSSYEFIPIIRSMIAKGGIPQEFLFLAMAESGFSSKAYSRKKASGIWQFMSFTARDMGLIINDYVDERRDPIKSTKAAIRYLQYLYQATGEWYLAAMAYNCGLGRLNKAIAKAGTKDLNVLLDEKAKYLPAETRNYIRTILSMSLAFGNLQKMRDSDREYLLNRGAMDTLAEVQVKGGTMLESIAAGAGMDIEDIKKYNRHIIYHFLPPNQQEYSIYLPYDKLAFFKQNFDQDNAKIAQFMFHRVKKGENLASIAKRYGITVATLKSTNNLSEKPRITANQRLLVPLASSDKIAQK